jgi:hypothetical protein
MLFFAVNVCIVYLCWGLIASLGDFFDGFLHCVAHAWWAGGSTCTQCLTRRAFSPLDELLQQHLPISGLPDIRDIILQEVARFLPDLCAMFVYSILLLVIWKIVICIAALCAAYLLDRLIARDVEFAAARVRAEADLAAAYAVRVFRGAGAALRAGAAAAAWAVP